MNPPLRSWVAAGAQVLLLGVAVVGPGLSRAETPADTLVVNGRIIAGPPGPPLRAGVPASEGPTTTSLGQDVICGVSATATQDSAGTWLYTYVLACDPSSPRGLIGMTLRKINKKVTLQALSATAPSRWAARVPFRGPEMIDWMCIDGGVTADGDLAPSPFDVGPGQSRTLQFRSALAPAESSNVYIAHGFHPFPPAVQDTIGLESALATVPDYLADGRGDFVLGPAAHPRFDTPPKVTPAGASLLFGWTSLDFVTGVFRYGRTRALGDSMLVGPIALFHSGRVDSLRLGTKYFWQAAIRDTARVWTITALDSFVSQTGPLGVGPGRAQPFLVSVGYPNPARSSVNFDVGGGAERQARVTVYDLAGRVVWSEAVAVPAEGRIQYVWRLQDSGGKRVHPGMYMIRFESMGESVRRPVLVR